MEKNNREERFDEKFGKDGREKNSYSIGRKAGCDDCYANILERAEHKQFVKDEINLLLDELLSEVSKPFEEKQEEPFLVDGKTATEIQQIINMENVKRGFIEKGRNQITQRVRAIINHKKKSINI